jgi:hypothetical protein
MGYPTVLTPERKADIVKTNPNMADEIPLANVVRFERDGRLWSARIGPGGLGLIAHGRTPRYALVYLMDQCERLEWAFDEGWAERLE